MDEFNSSSSDTENPIAAPFRICHESASDDDSDIQQPDEELVESIRNALHLAVGNICREQDATTAAAAADDDIMGDTPSFTMSNDAIAALTDLTYHYSTTLLANDLVTFSSHAGRKLIKPEDVLLMSRKDKNGIGADMKRKMKEIQSRSSKERGKKKKSVSPTRRKSNSDRSTSPAVRKKSPKTVAGKKQKITKNKKRKPMESSSSSSSSCGEEGAELNRMCQRVAERERRKSAQKNRNDRSLNDFIDDDNDFFHDKSSDGEIDFQNSAKKKRPVKSNFVKKPVAKAKPKKNGLFNSSKTDVFNGLSDSSSDVIGKPKYKTVDAYFSKSGKKAEGKSEDMAIDLSSDSNSD